MKIEIDNSPLDQGHESPIAEMMDTVPKAMSESYTRWFNDRWTLLKYPQEIISFIDSCGFTCDQLSRIARAVEDMKWSDYETEDRLGEDLTEFLREKNGEFDKI